MHKVLELVLLTNEKLILVRVALMLIEHASKPRLHRTTAVHLEETVVKQSADSLSEVTLTDFD